LLTVAVFPWDWGGLVRSGAVRLAGAALLAGCGSTSLPTYGGNGGGGNGGHSTTITVGNDYFAPSPDTVAAGQVTFAWATPSHGHTVNRDSGPATPPNTAGIVTSGTFVVTLTAGTYTYHCTVHGGAMSGAIIVH
jgi:plastocyanin